MILNAKTFALCLSLLFSLSCATNKEGLDFLAENAKKPGVVTLASGLQYKVLNKGSGLYHPAVGTPCSCHYSGQLMDGTVFDSSYERGEPTTFAPNQVIKGWTEAMQLMVEGDKWEMYIPSELAYGDRGSPPKIPGESMLIFQMEIVKILDGDKVLAITCSLDKENCNEKEQAYIDKTAAWEPTKVQQELERVRKVLGESSKTVKQDLVEWLKRRKNLLEQMVSKAKGEGESTTAEL
ncbi:hypothetical protein MPSEU_000762300 [Mayamaea pseudoterrestris]|nr:hypothetical protein MPSEU_000762300 [Mayamaea pseudoterrestris]